jgi:hypothetical protein
VALNPHLHVVTTVAVAVNAIPNLHLHVVIIAATVVVHVALNPHLHVVTTVAVAVNAIPNLHLHVVTIAAVVANAALNPPVFLMTRRNKNKFRFTFSKRINIFFQVV